MIIILEGWQFFFQPHPYKKKSISRWKKKNQSHINMDEKILMRSDFIKDFLPLTNRNSSVWKWLWRKMSPEMKKGTFGFQNTLVQEDQQPWPIHQNPLALLFKRTPYRTSPVPQSTSCAPRGPQPRQFWSLQLAFTSTAGPPRMFAEWTNE